MIVSINPATGAELVRFASHTDAEVDAAPAPIQKAE